jgi:fructose-bisphosphate aldolase class II
MAISVGNVHLQTSKQAKIDFAAIRAIEARTDVPLVLHGGSGIAFEVREKLAQQTQVCKFNIGTELRQTFGKSLRGKLAENPQVFDRIQIMQMIAPEIIAETRKIIRNLAGS